MVPQLNVAGPEPKPSLQDGQDGDEAPEDFGVHRAGEWGALSRLAAPPWSLEPGPAPRLRQRLVSFFDLGGSFLALVEAAGADGFQAHKGCCVAGDLHASSAAGANHVFHAPALAQQPCTG